MNRDRILWLVLLAGPLIWLTSFLANFALAPLACSYSWKPLLLAVSGAAMLLTVISGTIAFSQWQRLGNQMPGEGGDQNSRATAMAVAAMVTCGFSALTILAQTIVETLLGACQ